MRWLPRNQDALNQLWEDVQLAITKAGPDTIRPPGIRTNADDWVMRGVRMPMCVPCLLSLSCRGLLVLCLLDLFEEHILAHIGSQPVTVHALPGTSVCRSC